MQPMGSKPTCIFPRAQVDAQRTRRAGQRKQSTGINEDCVSRACDVALMADASGSNLQTATGQCHKLSKNDQEIMCHSGSLSRSPDFLVSAERLCERCTDSDEVRMP